MPKRLLYITTRLPWPQDSGRKVTLYHYCKGLHELCGYDVYLYSFLESGQSLREDEVPDFVAGVKLARPVGALEKAFNLIRILGKGDEPLQNALMYSRENALAIACYAESLKPDAVIVDMVRLAPYFDAISGIDCLKSLDIDDLLSKRYERQLGQDGGFLGAYGAGASGFTRMLAKIGFIKERVLQSEARRMSAAERKYASLFDSVFFVSPLEAEAFSRANPDVKTFAGGMGVDVDYYGEPMTVKTEACTASFVGNLAFEANMASLRLIVDGVLPKLRHELTLRVIGNCPADVAHKLSEHPDVVLTGRVDDLRPLVRSTSVFLAPIAYGSGVKTKIVEAMAMGMCVVTNATGAEGLTAQNGSEIIVEDDPNLLAHLLDDLLDDPARLSSIGSAAARYARENHDWDDLLGVFVEEGF